MNGASEASAAFVEQLCACMRMVAARGVDHDESRRAAEITQAAIAGARPPLALQFLTGAVLRDRQPVPLTLELFRRAQIVARALHEYGVAEIELAGTPTTDELLKLVKLLVDSTQGQRKTRAPRLGSIVLKPLRRVDPLAESHNDTDLDLMLRQEIACAVRVLETRTERWSWTLGQSVVSTLERGMAFSVTAMTRALELGEASWTLNRRALVCAFQALAVLSRLQVSDERRRAASHALLALSVHGLGQRLAFGAAARAAAGALSTEATGPSPHRLRVATLLFSAADPSAPQPPVLGLLKTIYTLELERVPERGPRLSRIDLQAKLSDLLGATIDDGFGRALLSAFGPFAAGSHVMSGGRLGVVVGQSRDAARPFVLTGGHILEPDQPVTPYSPLGMTPWAKS